MPAAAANPTPATEPDVAVTVTLPTEMATRARKQAAWQKETFQEYLVFTLYEYLSDGDAIREYEAEKADPNYVDESSTSEELRAEFGFGPPPVLMMKPTWRIPSASMLADTSCLNS